MKRTSDRELMADELYGKVYNELVILCRSMSKTIKIATDRFNGQEKEYGEPNIELDEALAIYDDFSKMIVGYNRIFECVNKADISETEIRELLTLSKNGILQTTYNVLTNRGYDIAKMEDSEMLKAVLMIASTVSILELE